MVTTGSPYSDLTDGESIEITGVYKIKTGATEDESRSFRIRVSAHDIEQPNTPAAIANGGAATVTVTELTEQFAVGFTKTQGVEGLTINTDGTWEFDPTNGDYNQLSAGDIQEIEVTYDVKDADQLNNATFGGTDSNQFTIRLSGTNDAPDATFVTAQTSTEDANNGTFTQAAGYGAVTGSLSGFFGAGQTFEFKSATVSTNGGASSALTAVGGLTITAATGAISFNPDHADYAALTQVGNSSVINVVYKVTSASGESFTNDFNIDLDVVDDGAGGTGNLVTITAPKILGQLTATDDDLRTTLEYEAVGAPVEGLIIDKDTGAWSFDPSNEAYQYLQKDQTLAIQVDYSVTDEEGASDTNSFTITLTGTNDLPELTGVASTLPGGTEDQDYEITKLQLLAGYTDVDLGETGSLKVINLVAKDDSGNNLLKDDGTSRFTPDDLADPTKWTFDVPANFNGNVNVTYEIEDVKGGKIQSSTRFNLGAVNDAPIKVTADVHTFANETEDIAFTITETDLLAGYNDCLLYTSPSPRDRG